MGLFSIFGSAASNDAVIAPAGPVANALLSFPILGEPPALMHLVGGLLILGGVRASLRK